MPRLPQASLRKRFLQQWMIFSAPATHERLPPWTKERQIPTTSIIGGENGMRSAEDEFLGRHVAVTKILRASYTIRPGCRNATQLREGTRRGTITSTKGFGQLGTFDFDFDSSPAFQVVASPTPAFQRRPMYRTCEASPSLDQDASRAEAGGKLRT